MRFISEEKYAADYSDCVVCELMLFPGEEVVSQEEGNAHSYHFTVIKMSTDLELAIS